MTTIRDGNYFGTLTWPHSSLGGSTPKAFAGLRAGSPDRDEVSAISGVALGLTTNWAGAYHQENQK